VFGPVHSRAWAELGQGEDAVGISGMMPKRAILAVFAQYGLLDIDEKPVTCWAASVLNQVRKAGSRARREFLACRRAEKRFKNQADKNNVMLKYTRDGWRSPTSSSWS